MRRRGLLRRGTVRYVELETPEALFIGRTDRGGRLRLLPDVDVTTWTAGVVQAFGRAAAADGDLRERISRAGWSFG